MVRGRKRHGGPGVATIFACVVPTPIALNHWDHTYARSDDGFAWGCWGRSTGGYDLHSASGSSECANCLAGPHGRAGILYLVTGVCHQAANRILTACGID